MQYRQEPQEVLDTRTNWLADRRPQLNSYSDSDKAFRDGSLNAILLTVRLLNTSAGPRTCIEYERGY